MDISKKHYAAEKAASYVARTLVTSAPRREYAHLVYLEWQNDDTIEVASLLVSTELIRTVAPHRSGPIVVSMLQRALGVDLDKAPAQPGDKAVMTAADITERVEAIRSSMAKRVIGVDDAAWHCMEDDLWQEVLRAIAAGAQDPRALAQAALETKALEFCRWYE
jgi:hypothetical protein